MRRATLLVLALVAAGCTGDAPPVATPQAPAPPGSGVDLGALGLRLDPLLAGFDRPVLLTHDARDERYVVEQGGRVWRLADGARGDVWLDLTDATRAGGEQGLLGLAFEPDGERAYVSYTDLDGDSVLERVHADGARERLLVVAQPFPNHNGGHLAFGPDAYLYWGLGDGGSGGDPQGNGQDPTALLGSLLRLDVSGETGYRDAPGNPWGPVWAKGLRNPWRFSFDRATGDLYVGDVGQNRVEEIDFLPAGAPAGANFGWNVYEGTQRFTLLGETFSPHTPPIAEYTHDDGCSVTGGHVYRGSREPALTGTYFLGDYCSGKVWGLRQAEGAWRLVELLDTKHRISSFGEDEAGEVYLVDHGGSIHRLAVASG